MKDSQGREYDGWAVRRANGHLDPWFFERTKVAVLDHFQGMNETRRHVRARLRRWGFTIVKVRLAEMAE